MMELTVDLLDRGGAYTARRETWPEDSFVFGIPAREIEHKDIEATLVFDSHVAHFLKGKPLKLGRMFFKFDGEVVMPWTPTQEDLCSVDWLLYNHSEMIDHKMSLNDVEENIKEEV